MEHIEGSKETQELGVFLVKLIDHAIDKKPAAALLALLPDALRGIGGIEKVPDELLDLDAEESKELSARLAQEFTAAGWGETATQDAEDAMRALVPIKDIVLRHVRIRNIRAENADTAAAERRNA